METTTILRVRFKVSEEDLQRFGIELIKDEEERPNFQITFLSKHIGDIDNVNTFKELFSKIFKAPSKIFIHTEDILESYADDNKAERTIKINDHIVTEAILG